VYVIVVGVGRTVDPFAVVITVFHVGVMAPTSTRRYSFLRALFPIPAEAVVVNRR
jgi:hypothetical protein